MMMFNYEFNHEREIHLYTEQGVLVYDDGEGDPEALFYHSADDLPGCILEAKQRRDIQAYLDESDLIELYQDRGDAVNDCIIPVTNTTDVLGIFKGEVEFSPT